MSARRKCSRARSRQNGSVLFVSLIILLILSSLAISTANTAIVENKMAGATRSLQMARSAADSATSEAKVRIAEAASANGAANVCAQLRCLVRTPDSPFDPAELMQTEAARSVATTFRIDFTQLAGEDESSRLAASPTYIIEDIGDVPAIPALPPGPGAASPRSFRITSRGVGSTADIEQVSETVFAVAH